MTDEHHRPDPPPVPGRLLDQLDDLMTIVERARPVPLSSSVMVNQEDLLARLENVLADLPEELRAARWMVHEREAYVARTNEKAREVIAKAKARSDDLVADHYIVQEAVAEANELVRNAEAEARRIRLEAEDYADARLAEVETVLGELLQDIRHARGGLREARPAPEEPPVSG